MPIRIDGHTAVPVYRQIVEAIKHQVATGELKHGQQLPTVRGLAQELQVDRNTALRAYRILDREGVISLQHGRGTFVATRPSAPPLARHRLERLGVLLNEGIARALSLGYAPEEIERAFARRMTHWQRARRSARKAR